MPKIKSWEYVAGLYDGEGTFSSHKKRGAVIATSLAISITQCLPNRIIIDELSKFLIKNKIKHAVRTGRKQKKTHSGHTTLTVQGSTNIIKFVDLCLPHLLLKVRAAKLVRVTARSIIRRKEHRAKKLESAVAEYKNGTSRHKICRKFGLSDKAFLIHLERLNIRIRSRSETMHNVRSTVSRDFWSKGVRERVQQAAKLRESGTSLREISRTLYMCRETLRKYFKLYKL